MTKKIKINSEFVNNIVDILLEKDLADNYNIIMEIDECQDDCFAIKKDSTIIIEDIENEI